MKADEREGRAGMDDGVTANLNVGGKLFVLGLKMVLSN